MRIAFRHLCFTCCILALIAAFPVQGQDLQLNNLTGVRGGNLVVGVTSDPSGFNRMMASGLANAAVTERLSADLVHINRSTLRLEPSLATQWEADKTSRIYTIHLRRGVRFSDGSPFSADDVLFTFQVLTDPKIESTISGQIETNGSFPTIKKIDDFTLTLTFNRPIGMGLRMLDSVPILPKSRLLKAYQEGRFDDSVGADRQSLRGRGPRTVSAEGIPERNPHRSRTQSLLLEERPRGAKAPLPRRHHIPGHPGSEFRSAPVSAGGAGHGELSVAES